MKPAWKRAMLGNLNPASEVFVTSLSESVTTDLLAGKAVYMKRANPDDALLIFDVIDRHLRGKSPLLNLSCEVSLDMVDGEHLICFWLRYERTKLLQRQPVA